MDREKTSKMLKSKTAIKMFSVFLSILLWFTVLNTTNPSNTQQIVVPLTLSNMGSLSEKSLGIKNSDYAKEVIITVEGRRNDLDELSDKDFSAVVDMNDIVAEGSHSMQIRIIAPDNSYYSMKSVSPERLRLEVEKTVEHLFSVEVIPEGEPADSYVVLNGTAFPGDIAITSLKSVISSIGRVVVSIDVNQLDRNISLIKFCRIYNTSGEEMLEFKDKFSVEARINVAKRVPIVPVIIGKPGNDVFESTRQIYPENVLITGSTEILSRVNEIKTFPIDISGITIDAEYAAQLDIPEGVQLYDSLYSVNVNISVGSLETSEIVIPAEDIEIIGKDGDNKYDYKIITPSISVKVKGLRTNIEALTASKFAPAVNAELLKMGTHRLAVELQDVDGISVNGSYFVEVEITESEDEETPPDNTSPEPEQSPKT